MDAQAHTNNDGICIFIKFALFVYAKIGTFIPKKKNAPNFTSIKLVWHNHCNTSFYACKEKSAGMANHPGTGYFIVFLLQC